MSNTPDSANNPRSEMLGNAPVTSLMIKFAVPSIIAMLVGALFRMGKTFTLDIFHENLFQTFPLIKIYNILGIISSLFSHFYALCNKLWRFSQFFNFTFVHFNNAIWTIVIDLLQRS